ncbi:MAG: septum site-determining protein MinC [Helicobacter sp.]|uniref:septum site-determining protein MinC n=1 Tax=Helicobacter sp. TaxID=218 RepID=UPI0025C3E4DB|nr:septum site-determining protein MinC [Helicobacter sp.]MCH5314060.1 septum site-determining protein MinC [Helicobacter sp.]
MLKTRQRKIALFEFEENVNTQECIAFITKHLPLLQYHTLGFRGRIDEALQTFLQTQGLSFALLSGTIPERNNKMQSMVIDSRLSAQSPQENGTQKALAHHKSGENRTDSTPHNAESTLDSPAQGAFLRTLWLHRIVRSGEEIYHNGDIVIESRINSGARVVAEGNLFIFGECRGSIEAQGDFIICHKIFTPAILFQDTIIHQEFLHKINQSNALFKMIFKKGDTIAIKDLV